MKKVKKVVIEVPGVSWHLRKEGIPLSPVVRAGDFVFVCVVGSWPKKFDVEIDCIAVVNDE